ncbi:alpha/beta hydrolase family esterase [Demetria terragena]|uniref:alpha/beta hydrolase family esterase n=1 Tax=Demetria terragena TaxID=63959 RepID=UPI00036A75ED|nr:PHB depolymerase family esterase [Demetria terragena]
MTRSRTLASFLAGGIGLTGLAVAAPAQAATQPNQVAGCSTPATQSANTSTKRAFTSGGLERDYILHLPKKYDRDRAWPVIVAFHGRGSTGTELEGFSGLSGLPAIVAYPNGVIGDDNRQAWQGAPYAAEGVNDVAMTRALLNDINKGFCADPNRVYATGKSNGGGFANLLACRLPDRIAAIAPVAAALYPASRQGCAKAAPKPVLGIHGTDDVTIPYAGDQDRDLPMLNSWAREWATKAGCTDKPQTRVLAYDAVDSRYRGCGDNQVGLVSVMGGGHTWPGADAYSGGGYTTQSVEAADLAWAFFKKHALAPTTGAQS